jgi:hypothetical protein
MDGPGDDGEDIPSTKRTGPYQRPGSRPHPPSWNPRYPSQISPSLPLDIAILKILKHIDKKMIGLSG